jgi:hypothetical protein
MYIWFCMDARTYALSMFKYEYNSFEARVGAHTKSVSAVTWTTARTPSTRGLRSKWRLAMSFAVCRCAFLRCSFCDFICKRYFAMSFALVVCWTSGPARILCSSPGLPTSNNSPSRHECDYGESGRPRAALALASNRTPSRDNGDTHRKLDNRAMKLYTALV